MKKILIFLILVLSFTTNSQTKKYYRNVYQTIFGEYVGVYPIDSIQANKTNHYVYSFDDLNRVVSIESFERISGYYLYSNILLSPMLEFEYEENTKFIYNRVFDWDNETIRSEEYYVVNYAGNKVKQITTKSSVLDDEYFEESNMEFIYNSDNLLIKLKMNGQSPYAFAYRGIANLDVKLNRNNQIVSEIIEENLADPEFPIEYVKLEFSYDENGNFLTIKSYNQDNTLNNSGYNVAYTVYSYDKNGYETGKIMYGFENERVDYISTEYIYETEETLTYVTPCEKRSIYDSNGSLISTKTFNKSGEPFEDEFGIHEIAYKADLNSGVYTEFYYNAKHQKVNGQMGFAGKEIHKDSKGRITYEKYLDSLDQPIINSFGVFIVVDEYQDEEGTITETYLDANGSRMADNTGAYKYEKYIEQESSVYEKAFGIEGQLLGEDEIYDFRIRYSYTAENSLLISTSHYDLDRKPILCDQNFYQELNTYSDDYYLLSTQYFDTELNPVNAYFNDLSYAKIEYKRDEVGNEIEMAYFDMDGNRAVDEYMISIYKTAYNSMGGIVQVDRYNTEMELLNPTIGYATVKYQYDSNFSLSEIAFYNHKGELWQDELGVAKYTFVNENNQVIKKAFFNSLNKPTTEPQGAYQIATSYVEGDKISEIKYLNKKGKKMNNLEGCHRINYSYNESGNLSRISLFNKKGKPVMADPLFYGTKFVFVEFVYDEAGYLLELNYFNENGEIVFTQTS
jgi:hypothetical protein